jgi:hypothetical protein
VIVLSGIFFGASDDFGSFQNEFAVSQHVPCPVDRDEKPKHQTLNKDYGDNQHNDSEKAALRLLRIDKEENDPEHDG